MLMKNTINKKRNAFKTTYRIINALYWPFAFLIIILGILSRFQISIVPFSTMDTWGFLKPALALNKNHQLERLFGRPIFYPIFLSIILKLFNNLNAISLVQHLLGIFGGIILLLTWRRINKLLPPTPGIQITFDCIGLAMLANYFFNIDMIMYEHTIISEAIYNFLMICLVSLIVLWFESRKNRNFKGEAWLSISMLFYAVFLFSFQPRFGLAIIIPITLTTISILSSRQKSLAKILTIVLLACAVLLVLYIPNKYAARTDLLSKTLTSEIVLGNYAPIVAEQINDDINKSPDLTVRYDKTLLKEFYLRLKSDIDTTKGVIKLLGYDCGGITWNGASRWLAERLDSAPEKIINFNYYYTISAILNHPYDFIKRMMLQLSVVYSLDSPVMVSNRLAEAIPYWEYSKKSIYSPWWFKSNFKYYREVARESKIILLESPLMRKYYVDLEQSINNLGSNYSPIIGRSIPPSFLSFFHAKPKYILPIFVIFFTLITIFYYIKVFRPITKQLNSYIGIISVTILIQLLMHLSIATAINLEDHRYIHDHYSFLIFNYYGCVTLFFISGLSWVHSRKKNII